MTSVSLERISHYRILKKLGAGGMGEVYLAEDLNLERLVALKLLPDVMASDHRRARRFLQEAKAASALSHPNVCVIHEIGQSENRHPFIAMEFVDGKGLDTKIAGQPLDAADIVEMGIQIADALEAAHSKGIIHRDIKPANIMVTARGQVKVLDFGLAKITAPGEPSTLANVTTVAKTEPGVVMGTVQYMSPEQALGRQIDERTDLFSLGVVLYEMATGRPPFTGASPTETIDKITHAQPEAIARFNYNVPPELERIIRKALRKDKQSRYQTAKDLLVDLKNLKEELAFETKLENSITPDTGGTRVTPTGAQLSLKSASGQTPSTTQFHAAQTTQDARTARYRKVLLTALAILVLAAAGFEAYRRLGSGRANTLAATLFNQIKVTKITATGNAVDSAISPDGKYAAYVLDEAGRRSLWVTQVAIASNARIFPPSDVQYFGLTFSPDGSYIYFNMVGPNNTPGFYQVPVLGGTARKVFDQSLSGVRFSPDGKQIAFVRGDITNKELALILANADGTEQRELISRKFPYDFGIPAWSSDGKIIACPITGSDTSGSFSNIIEVNLSDGRERLIAPQRWQEINQIAWLKDGSGLLICAKDEASSFQQVWMIPYPDGLPRKITNDLIDYGGISLTADSRILVTHSGQRLSNVWVTPNGDARRPSQTTSGAGRYFDLSWTPDGHILYASDATGSADIWEISADGTGQKQITNGAHRNYAPAITPDGRYIVFHSNRTGPWNIWRMDRDGSNVKQLTDSTEHSNWPQCSPDGRWVVYQRESVGSLTSLWKVSIDGGVPVKLTDKASMRPAFSPDGKWIACWYWGEKPDLPTRIAIIPIEGGQPIKQFDIERSVVVSYTASIRWSADGRGLTYVDNRNGVDNIWLQPIDGSKAVQLTDFKSDRIESFAWSRDGRLACSRGFVTSDVVLIRDSQ
jgi:eukaryotic-like serine/threonine-protein kinase